MKVLNATYDYSVVITDDTENVAINTNSVIFENTGTVDAYINTNYILEPGKAHILRNDNRVKITSTFNITFIGAGTKRVNVIKESIA